MLIHFHTLRINPSAIEYRNVDTHSKRAAVYSRPCPPVFLPDRPYFPKGPNEN